MSTPTTTHTAVPNVQATAPERIYLVIGEDCPADARFSDLADVSWWHEKIDGGIEYVRADLASLPAPQGEQQDSRTPTVAPGGQPLAKPNSQDGDSVLPPVEPSGATLDRSADVVREFAYDLRQLALLSAANRGIPLEIPASIARHMHAFMLGRPSLFDRIVGAPQVDRGESNSEGGES